MKTQSVNDVSIDEALQRARRKFEMTPKVAIAGFGNAGKSSLFNAIYGGHKAAVSMRTDETKEAQTACRFGIDFTDTPGVGTGRFSLEQVEQLAVFDRQHVVVHVLNGATAISKEDEALHHAIERSRARRVTVVNKVDILDPQEQLEFAESVLEKLGLREEDFLFVSAKRQLHVEQLVRLIADILPDAMQDAFIGQQTANVRLKEERVRRLIYSKAILCAGVALTPVPVADMVVITPIQVAMVATIGYLHGVDITKERITELLSVLGAGYGLRQVARQLVKLIPGAGSVVSASVTFTGTVALGEAANLWFKRQMNVSVEELRSVFERTARDVHKEFDAHKQAAEQAASEVTKLDADNAPGEGDPERVGRLLRSVMDAADKSDDSEN